NYIYSTVAGFSEFDTFRSNQIREGVLTREQALALVAIENRPRLPSMRAYAELAGFDLDLAMHAIQSIPKLHAALGNRN
ncbi:MAG: glucosamine 6-phosphate synthetase, partial [Fibrobacteria bacterium]